MERPFKDFLLYLGQNPAEARRLYLNRDDLTQVMVQRGLSEAQQAIILTFDGDKYRDEIEREALQRGDPPLGHWPILMQFLKET